MAGDIIFDGIIMTSTPLGEWIAFIFVMLGVTLRTYTGYIMATKKNPLLVFDVSYVIKAGMAGLFVYMAFTANDTQLVGTGSLLKFALTSLAFGFAGNSAVNELTKQKNKGVVYVERGRVIA